ncbi:FIG000233: metal-dependent hydrolase [Richelia intracellularis HH01]|uniref:Endoribonuclease YbeY n=1 Tax=Richelia intracellularis HH01 TaxID=1165094 RepID=M1X2M0_9NOST|nr:rRNA maturation RNase YbeY [Richelia intracellularis]CCH67060.1 FIG000233: metal-dependent hydrolase [Richelia intracellularis HH01]HAE06489.1 rRNA maturation RNase YbeY [Richelia sp.]
MQVEVCIQSQINQSSKDKLTNLNLYPAGIYPQTWKNWFKTWLEYLQPHIPPAPSYELGVLLTSDEEIQFLNANYRFQNKPTDVLAFATLEVKYPKSEDMLNSMPLSIGDIIISVETAQRQAQKQEHLLLTELAWLATHGLLHLLGWDHHDEYTLQIMFHQQVALLNKVGITIDFDPL